MAAIAVALLLVPAAVAGDTATGWGMASADTLSPQANGLGRGFFGIDLEDLGASGELPVDQLSQELMRLADDPNALATAGDPITVPTSGVSIPGSAMQAYKKAAEILAAQLPNCHLHWSLLASIGRIESGHGHGGQVSTRGDTLSRILGPVLDGNGFAAIADTDGGALDGNTQWDRAVGPMQFIPSTWKSYAADGNGDGVSNPHNFYDAATAAGKYLCAGGVDLGNPQARYAAVFRYNHSDSYVRTVLIWADAYANGVTEIPDGLSGDTGSTGASVDTNGQASAPPPEEPIAVTPSSTPPPAPTPPPTIPTTITPKPPSSPSTPPTPPSSTPPSSTPPSSEPPSCPPSSTPPSSSKPSSSSPQSSSEAPASSTSDAPSSGTSPQGAAAPDDPCKPGEGE